MDLPDSNEAITAAALVWSLFRSVEWSENDDPDDVLLFEMACSKIRLDYPWLDPISDGIERNILGGYTIEEGDDPEHDGPGTWVDEDGSAFIAPPS